MSSVVHIVSGVGDLVGSSVVSISNCIRSLSLLGDPLLNSCDDGLLLLLEVGNQSRERRAPVGFGKGSKLGNNLLEGSLNGCDGLGLHRFNLAKLSLHPLLLSTALFSSDGFLAVLLNSVFIVPSPGLQLGDVNGVRTLVLNVQLLGDLEELLVRSDPDRSRRNVLDSVVASSHVNHDLLTKGNSVLLGNLFSNLLFLLEGGDLPFGDVGLVRTFEMFVPEHGIDEEFLESSNSLGDVLGLDDDGVELVGFIIRVFTGKFPGNSLFFFVSGLLPFFNVGGMSTLELLVPSVGIEEELLKSDVPLLGILGLDDLAVDSVGILIRFFASNLHGNFFFPFESSFLDLGKGGRECAFVVGIPGLSFSEELLEGDKSEFVFPVTHDVVISGITMDEELVADSLVVLSGLSFEANDDFHVVASVLVGEIDKIFEELVKLSNSLVVSSDLQELLENFGSVSSLLLTGSLSLLLTFNLLLNPNFDDDDLLDYGGDLNSP